eukprot:Phypoly_transcript_00537.p1 GENE.Phypoly_transcript_00537~~Phypoly_transcript_00537.p1  ORF type:complete len:1451 (+),score=177.67 Phypoly_transcript_00537:50-4354(+)
MTMSILDSLDLSYNRIDALPVKLLESLPRLRWLDVSNNRIDVVPPDLADVAFIDLSHNPLASIPPMFREDKNKILFYAKYGGTQESWNQVKVMLVGHEGVGKTTFLRSLQGHNSPAGKNPNLSTNGVDISTVELPYYLPEKAIIGRITGKREKIVFNVWDFGGQTVFHSTHRFFLTSMAIYVVIYNMADDQTHGRLQHWMQQIQSVVDMQGASMPILIVGTHADKLTSAQQEEVMNKIARLYPVSNKTTGVQGHYAVSLSSKSGHGLQELKEALITIAREHPKLGIGQVQVPSFLMLIKEKLDQLKSEKKYLSWSEYKEICQEVVITPDFPIVEWTLILQELGVLVWNNTVQLKDVCTYFTFPLQCFQKKKKKKKKKKNQEAISRSGGVALRSKLYSIMRNKIAETALFPVIFGLLERFEIIMRMRNYYSGIPQLLEAENGRPEEDYKYFVPSLLLPFNPKKDSAHPALQFWKRLSLKSGFVMLKRRFTWTFYPANFFPRLLLRLMHMQVTLLGSWVDAVVLMNQDQSHYAFVHLFSQEGSFILEVTVMQDNTSQTSANIVRDSLISELAYAITRLNRDMWEDRPVKHEVVICVPANDFKITRLSSAESEPNLDSKVLEIPVLFADCLGDVAKGTISLPFTDQDIRLDIIAPDLSCCTQIPRSSLSDMVKISQGGFGVVYKAVLYDRSITKEFGLPVAVKELKRGVEDNEAKIYEFQHEMLIMSKMKHKNLVQLYGAVKSPLSLVMEYVPFGDLHELLQEPEADNLTFKWRLKMAIDIARGMSHLHKQTPPICHSDLRAPNIFVASLDEDADVIGKVADFGMAQQSPFSVQILGNLVETAPETWGDEGLTKGAMYDERSDVFSYAIILWRLFGSNLPEPIDSSHSSSPMPSPRSFISFHSSSPSPSPSPSPLSHSNAFNNSPTPPVRINPFINLANLSASIPSPRAISSHRSDSPTATSISCSPPGTPSSAPPSPFGGTLRRRLGDSCEARQCDPYNHLRDQRGQINKWTLRNKIREGERPIIGSDCPAEIARLMEECWQFDATLRPFFPLVVRRLTTLYGAIFGEDDFYLSQEMSDGNILPTPSQLGGNLANSEVQTTFSQDHWDPRPQISSEPSSWSIVSMIFVNDEIWAGTNTGAVLIINPKNGKLEHIIMLQATGRISLLHAGRWCVWASCESEKIWAVNVQTRFKIMEIDNEFPVTCMAISYHHAGPTTPVVWVADTRGFVSLWDLMTVQKYCRFQAVLGPNPTPVRSMCVMHEHMWIAVGCDIVAIETQTLQRVVQPTGPSRINGITCVPSMHQTWICSKDGSITLWEHHKILNRVTNTYEWNIVHLKTIKHDTEVKFVQPITTSLAPLSRGHIVSGDFNGKLTMWNSEAMTRPEEFPMPVESANHALQCALDVGEYGLWVGTMNPGYPLMRYHCLQCALDATTMACE